LGSGSAAVATAFRPVRPTVTIIKLMSSFFSILFIRMQFVPKVFRANSVKAKDKR